MSGGRTRVVLCVIGLRNAIPKPNEIKITHCDVGPSGLCEASSVPGSTWIRCGRHKPSAGRVVGALIPMSFRSGVRLAKTEQLFLGWAPSDSAEEGFSRNWWTVVSVAAVAGVGVAVAGSCSAASPVGNYINGTV